MEFALFVLLGIVIYAYIGYPVLIFILSSIWGRKKNTITIDENSLPVITLFVAAYNEESNVVSKVENTFSLNYPGDKIRMMWVTDGSTDNTNKLLANYPQVSVYFEPVRKGKIHAMNRGMQFAQGDIIVFSDGNTLLGTNTLMEIAHLFQDKNVGCVAGEKRVFIDAKDGAAASGEGLYWKYESFVKQCDADFGSTVGAAGELFAVRKELYCEVEPDTILDDFIISLRIAAKGYRIAYSSEAYAIEKASASVKEEMKRKIRIAAGSFQSLGRLAFLLNPVRFPKLAFQFFSHKVIRWSLVPLSLPVIFVLNILLLSENHSIFHILLLLQVIAYSLAFLGHLLQHRSLKLKILFVPYYFLAANWAQWLGFFRFISGKQSVNWERAKRKQ